MAELYGKTNTVNRDTVINLQVHSALSLMHAQTTHTATHTGTHTKKDHLAHQSQTVHDEIQ